jgi:chromosome segregation ATPase
MKTKITTAVAIAALIGSTAFAKTDTSKQVEKLKVNAENSEANYDQYKSNLEIVNKNIDQADGALKDIRKMKTQLVSNTQNVEKNKQALVKLEQELVKFKTQEQEKIKADEVQIAELKKTLEKLEANKKMREQNVLAYDAKTEEVKKERADWDTQVAQMASLQKQLAEKEQKASEEKNAWTAKRKDYEGEARKWQNQAASARETYSKYKKLDE